MAEASDAPVLAPPVADRERNVLVLDLSKSMLAPLPEPLTEGAERQKIEVARTAVFRILENAAAAGSSFGLVTFTEVVRVPLPLTEINRQNLSYIENLIALLAPSGRSAIWDALAVAADMLRQGSAGVQGNIVLVTDGWDNASTKFDVRDPKLPRLRPERLTSSRIYCHRTPISRSESLGSVVAKNATKGSTRPEWASYSLNSIVGPSNSDCRVPSAIRR